MQQPWKSLFTSTGAASLLAFGLMGCVASTSAEPSTPQAQVTPMDHGSMGSGATMDHGSMTMDLGPADEAFDLRFIDAMILHHTGAVVMAEEALEKSNRPEIQTLAQAIIEAQEAEIQQMQAWRAAWYPNAGSEPLMYHAEMGHMMPMTSEMKSSMMMSGSLGEADDQFDLRFIDAMIPHHEGALVMAQEALAKSTRPEIRTLSQAILDSQAQEINEMKEWRKTWYNQ